MLDDKDDDDDANNNNYYNYYYRLLQFRVNGQVASDRNSTTRI